MWTQTQMRDGTYDFADLCEVNAVLDWREETERQIAESRKRG
jgi:hypothetical protein